MFDRVGPRPLVIPGAVLTSGALWGMTTLGADSSLGTVIAWHVTLNAGLALMFSPLMTNALGALPRRLYPHGSAIVSTIQQVAGAAGTALFITVMTAASVAGAGAGVDERTALMDGVHSALLCGAAISLLAVVGTLFVRRTTAPEEPKTSALTHP